MNRKEELDLKSYRYLLLAILLVSLLIVSGCGEQTRAKHYGGNYTIKLEKNEKLVDITWKDNNLWYLTKPMGKDDVAQTYKFKEDSQYGVFEGTITVVETK